MTVYVQTNSHNLLRRECGNAVVSRSVPTTICCQSLTDEEAVVTLTKTLRQVAFGVATFCMQILSGTSFELQRIGFLGGQVPGRQTVQRAELWRAIQVLSRMDEKTNIQIPIDAK